MDEPFAALDPDPRCDAEIPDRCLAASGSTIIFVTHHIDEAIMLSDRVVVMTAAPGRVDRRRPIDLPRRATRCRTASTNNRGL